MEVEEARLLKREGVGEIVPAEEDGVRKKAEDEEADEEQQRRRRKAEVDGRWVEVHVYLRGEGPRFKSREKLVGWDADRLDVRGLMERHGLKALYALSAVSGTRGLKLFANPKNGLSLTTYSGREGTVVRLDADPVEPLLSQLGSWAGAALLSVAIIALFSLTWGQFGPSTSPRTHGGPRVEEEGEGKGGGEVVGAWKVVLREMNEAPSWPVVLLFALFFVGLFWRRLTAWYSHHPHSH